MDYTTCSFRKNNYFVLYDMNDNLICYFENYNELFQMIQIPLRNLVIRFKQAVDYIIVIINSQRYKLYTYRKD